MEQARPPRAVGRVIGRVRTGRAVARVRPIERASTKITHLDPPPKPVFADTAGLRRRRLRVLSYVLVSLIILVLMAFWLSQLSDDVPVGSGLASLAP